MFAPGYFGSLLLQQVLILAPATLLIAVCWKPRGRSWIWVDAFVLTGLGAVVLHDLMRARLRFGSIVVLLAVLFFLLLFKRKPYAPARPRVPGVVLILLLLLCLALNCVHILDPDNPWQLVYHPFDCGRWGCAGAEYLMETGRLPYGKFFIGDTYGPLNYVLHAPFQAVFPVAEDYDWAKAARNLRFDQVFSGLDYTAVRLVALIFHLLTLSGMILLGLRRASWKWGVALACIYCASPPVWINLHQSSHVAAACFCLWAVVLVSRPFVAGILLGMAAGVLFYPIFFFPLWIGWYRKHVKRWPRFVAGLACVGIACLVLVLLFTEPESGHTRLGTFVRKTVLLQEGGVNLGPYGFWPRVPRLRAILQKPMMLCYGVFCVYLFFAPPPGLAGLIRLTAALGVGLNIWKSHLWFGTYSFWYFAPLLIVFLLPADAERFVTLLLREPFDYTKWQTTLWSARSVREISDEATAYRKSGAKP